MSKHHLIILHKFVSRILEKQPENVHWATWTCCDFCSMTSAADHLYVQKHATVIIQVILSSFYDTLSFSTDCAILMQHIQQTHVSLSWLCSAADNKKSKLVKNINTKAPYSIRHSN